MVAVATDNSLSPRTAVKCEFNNKNFHKKDARKPKDG